MNEGVLTNAIHGYFLVAIAYNVMSQIWLDWKGRGFAPTDPNIGILFVGVVYLFFLCHVLIPVPSFIAVMAVFIALIIRFGIVRHWVLERSDAYWSPTTRTLAVAINLFGVVALLLFLLR